MDEGYIEENIRKRKIAKANKEEFGVMYYKQTYESGNTSNKKLTRLVSSPLFVGFKAFEGGITC